MKGSKAAFEKLSKAPVSRAKGISVRRDRRLRLFGRAPASEELPKALALREFCMAFGGAIEGFGSPGEGCFDQIRCVVWWLKEGFEEGLQEACGP